MPRPLVPEGGGELFVTGYHPWWALEAEVTYPVASLDQVFLFEWEASAEGELEAVHGWPADWEPLVLQLREEGVGVAPTLTLFGAENFESVFANEGARDRLTAALLREMTAGPVPVSQISGLHLDVEVFDPVSAAARSGFSTWVEELADTLRRRAPGATVSLFLPALDPGDAYDEAFLAGVADYVVVQGYDLHYRTGPSAGPTAPVEGWDGLNLTRVLDRYDALGVPPGKILLSLPLYGYEWPVTGAEPGAATRGPGEDLPWNAPDGVEPNTPRARDQLRRHGGQRASVDDALWYSYLADDGWRQGWVDDGPSLAAKIRLVRSRGLAGVAFFTLVYGDERLWRELTRALR